VSGGFDLYTASTCTRPHPGDSLGECHGELRGFQRFGGGGGHEHLQRALQLLYHAVQLEVLVRVGIVVAVLLLLLVLLLLFLLLLLLFVVPILLSLLSLLLLVVVGFFLFLVI
jgi:hypothetical protein